MKTLKPFPSARNVKPRAEVVFPLPSPVTTMIKPRRRLLMKKRSDLSSSRDASQAGGREPPEREYLLYFQPTQGAYTPRSAVRHADCETRRPRTSFSGMQAASMA